MEMPTLVRIRAGWAAVGKRWAVFGSTENEAKERFQEAERKHAELAQRAQRAL